MNTIIRSDEIRLFEALVEVKKMKTVDPGFMTFNLDSRNPDCVELSPAPPSGFTQVSNQTFLRQKNNFVFL